MERERLEEVAAIRTLGGVLRRAFAQAPPAEILNVVGQDEFTNDVNVRVGPRPSWPSTPPDWAT